MEVSDIIMSELKYIRKDIKDLHGKVEALNMFKAKVVGISSLIGGIASLLVSILWK